MTTTVIIKTHDWPVQVTAVDRCADGSLAHTPMQPVPPHSESSPHNGFYCTDTRSLIITEMKAPKKDTSV